MDKTISPIQSLLQQRTLLQMEYAVEKEAYRKQTQTMGMGRKVKRGDAWFPLSVGRSAYNALNQMTIEVTRTADTDITHNFEFGKPVVFFSMSKDGSIRYFSFTAQVSYVDGDRMVVVIPEGHQLDIQIGRAHV